MAFKLTVFIALLIAIGVLSTRWYVASIRQFELRRAAREGEAGTRAPDPEAVRDGAGTRPQG